MQAQLSFTNWYQKKRSIFERMATYSSSVLSSLLSEANIAHLSVSHRVKDLKSELEKIERKGYADPVKEMTDLVGIRIITYIEADTQKAAHAVKKAFNIHGDKSLDKSVELGVDKIGYRSIHFVCDIGDARGNLPECIKFQGQPFEIQIRSVLQHAWAEIEHDRGYKFSGALPPHLDRRLNLIAGSLELADFEFNTIASELDSYEKSVTEKKLQGNLDLRLDATTIEAVLSSVRPKLKNCNLTIEPIKADLIDELVAFGVSKASDLNVLFTDDLIKAVNKYYSRRTPLGLLRTVMFWHDLEKYFEKSWKKKWQGFAADTARLLGDRYSKEKLESISKKYKVWLPQD